MAEIAIDGKMISLKVESPNSRNDRDGEPPELIVLHSTGGAFAGAVRWLMNALSSTKASSHFVVSRMGEIRQLVSIHRVAYHAGKSSYRGHSDISSCSIGIEMEHFDGQQDWPAKQLLAVAKLCAVLALKLRLKIEGIIGHSAVAYPRGRKIAPYLFPWRDFRRLYIAEITKLRNP